MNQTTSSLNVIKGSSQKSTRFTLYLIIGFVAIGGAIGGYIFLKGNTQPNQSPKSPTNEDDRITIKTIHPRYDPNLCLSTSQVGTIEPWYSADLKARASGIVTRVTKEIGDLVKRGELLVEIDVPESVQEVKQKYILIEQRRQELRVSEAKLNDAKAAKEVALATIKQKKSEVLAAKATRDFRKKRLDRFRELAAKGSAVASVVDEEERDYLASEATLESVSIGVEKALADLAEADSKIEAALADIDLRKTMIEVAIQDWERAKIISNFGKIFAPFDGIVTRRNVDPGSFVQNATSGSSEALISVARLDLLTIMARFPDTVAPFLDLHTPVSITIDELPDVVINSKVTRFSPMIQNTDRTIRVEVDVFNGTANEYPKLFLGVMTTRINEILPFDPISKAALILQSQLEMDALTKGDLEPFATPVFHHHQTHRRLMPGMITTMRLTLESKMGNFVVPSSAIYSRSGKPFILLVENGITKEYPVVVQLNDGRYAKIMITERDKQTQRPYNRELTEYDEVVLSRQMEIGDNRPVKTFSGD